jgi:hypothetical protein
MALMGGGRRWVVEEPLSVGWIVDISGMARRKVAALFCRGVDAFGVHWMAPILGTSCSSSRRIMGGNGSALVGRWGASSSTFWPRRFGRLWRRLVYCWLFQGGGLN